MAKIKQDEKQLEALAFINNGIKEADVLNAAIQLLDAGANASISIEGLSGKGKQGSIAMDPTVASGLSALVLRQRKALARDIRTRARQFNILLSDEEEKVLDGQQGPSESAVAPAPVAESDIDTPQCE